MTTIDVFVSLSFQSGEIQVSAKAYCSLLFGHHLSAKRSALQIFRFDFSIKVLSYFLWYFEPPPSIYVHIQWEHRHRLSTTSLSSKDSSLQLCLNWKQQSMVTQLMCLTFVRWG